MKISDLKIIEILWDGPFTPDGIKSLSEPFDYGLYQIYGSHITIGPNALLYIGQAKYQFLSKRLRQHDWINYEASEIKIYVGRVGGVEKIPVKEWEKRIGYAEKLLIYFCTPPYNSANIIQYGDIKDTLVLNFGKKQLIPYEVSTLYEDSDYNHHYDDWEAYSDD